MWVTLCCSMSAALGSSGEGATTIGSTSSGSISMFSGACSVTGAIAAAVTDRHSVSLFMSFMDLRMSKADCGEAIVLDPAE